MFVLCSASNKYVDNKVNEYKEFLSLLHVIKQKIATCGTKIPVILESMDKFEYPCLCLFIKKAIDNGIYQAFIEHEKNFCINRDDKKILKSCFFDMGRNMLNAELQNIDQCIQIIQESYEKARCKSSSDKKVNNTVIICITLLVLILIV